MSWMKCQSCNGVYNTKQVDGAVYFHACPPSVAPANARNENVPSTAPADTGKIISAGTGTQPTVAPIGAAVSMLSL